MARKNKPAQPSEVPLPAHPEVLPESTPEEPELPEEPEITPDKDPDEPTAPPELPETK